MKPSSTLLVFATLKEAQPSLELLGLSPNSNRSFYLFEGGGVLITGMGAIAAATAVSHYIQDFDTVWNLGVAGALNKNLSVGEMVEVGSAAKWSGALSLSPHALSLFEATHPLLGKGTPRLITSDYPVHSQELGKTLSQQADLLDMEGYGVATAAERANKPWRLTKRISDFCSEDGSQLIQKELPKAAKELASLLVDLFRN